MALAPVQVLVIGTNAEPDGSVVAELDRLAEAGIVRLVDLVIVQRTEDGALDTMPAPPGLHPGAGRIAEAFLAGPDGFADADSESVSGDAAGRALQGAALGAAGDAEVNDPAATPDEPSDAPATWSVLEAIPVGGTAVIALIEHVWAGPLRAALRASGAAALGESWLGPADLADLEAIVELQVS